MAIGFKPSLLCPLLGDLLVNEQLVMGYLELYKLIPEHRILINLITHFLIKLDSALIHIISRIHWCTCFTSTTCLESRLDLPLQFSDDLSLLTGLDFEGAPFVTELLDSVSLVVHDFGKFRNLISENGCVEEALVLWMALLATVCRCLSRAWLGAYTALLDCELWLGASIGL